MELIECREENLWNDWFLKQKQTRLPTTEGVVNGGQNEFLQSWEWGEFQKKVRSRSVRLRILEKGEIVGQIQGFEQKLFFGVKFIYIPKYQVSGIRYQVSELFDFFKKQGYIFARIEPLEKIEKPDKYAVFEVENRQPRNIFILDARQSEEEILEKMHAKTRYNIKLAQRNGVEIKQEKNADVFWGLNEETSARDKFKSHGRQYYEKMLEAKNCYQLNAYYNGEAAASIILFHFGDVVTYLHGASGSKHRNLMAQYLLQWEGIKLAKRLGAFYYDLGGVSRLRPSCGVYPANRRAGQASEKIKETCFHNYCWEAAHKWTGITRFKVGFGGAGKEYPQAVEVVFKPVLYGLFKLIKKIKNVF